MDFRLWLENDEEYETFGDPKEWHVGQIGILDESGFDDIAIIKVVRFEDVVKGDPEAFKFLDPNTIELYNPFGSMTYKRGESVPLQVIDAFGFHSERAAKSYNGFHFVGAQNLYRTIDDLIEKKMRVLYPDLLLQYWNSPKYRALITKYPQLKKKNNDLLDTIDYHPFDVQGYTVYVMGDPRAKKRQEELRKSGYPHPIHVYYFVIPELNTRSTELDLSRDPKFLKWWKEQKMGENGKFTTIKEALAAAEKYIGHMFYGE